MIKTILCDPRLFNFGIMALYTCAAFRWLFAGRYADCIYWVGALIITLTVTFGYKR